MKTKAIFATITGDIVKTQVFLKFDVNTALWCNRIAMSLEDDFGYRIEWTTEEVK